MSQSTLRNNVALGNGGGVSAGTVATVTLVETKGIANRALGSGGVAHFFGIMAATIDGITANGNVAGDSGGAFAMIDSIRTISTMANSTVNANRAGSKGGGLYVEDAAVSVTGSQLTDNSVERGDGGATATSGHKAQLSFSDTECVNIEVVLDWSNAGSGCPVDGDGMTCDTWSSACEDMAYYYGSDCSGCACK